NNIKIIYEREMTLLAKKRVFAILFSIVSVVLSLFVLIFINKTLVKAKSEGVLSYEDLLYLHERIWDIVYFICILFSIFLASMSINLDKKRYILDHILTTKVDRKDIVLGKLFSYISSVVSLSLLCMPMCMMPTFFGGISYVKMILLLILLIALIISFISVTLMFSAIIYQENISLFASILFGILVMVMMFYFKNNIVTNMYLYISVIASMLLFSIVCGVISIKSKVFDM
ncbi:MAG: hypothetical protein MJ151_01860, partial [Lachnospiraceae bacterium]|nr:hypothetical protein [Lachnospiraceae bacterium]